MKYNTFYTCEKNKLVEHNPLYETTLTDAILRPKGEAGLFTQNGVEVIKKDKSSPFEDCDYLSSFAVGLVSVGGIIFFGIGVDYIRK